MKKLITIILVIIIIFAGYIFFKNKDLVKISNPKVNDVAQTEVKIDSWSTYNNPQYGLQLDYPSEFKVEEKITGEPKIVAFESLLVKLGSSFEVNIYNKNTFKNIVSLDTIPKVTRMGSEVLSTNNISNSNGIDLQVIKGVQYNSKNGQLDKKQSSDYLNIVFMRGSNAYSLNWSCWSNTACFNDEIVNKLADSIKFTK